MTEEELQELADQLRIAYYGTTELILSWGKCSVDTQEAWVRVANEAFEWLAK